MTLSNPHSRFPILSTLLLLTLVTLLTAGLMYFLLPMLFENVMPAYMDQLDPIITRSALIVLFAAVLSAIPLFLRAHRGVMATVSAYFIGSGIRLVLCLGAAVYLCLFRNQPAIPTGLTMVMLYVPLLLLESALVGRYLFQLDRSAKTVQETPVKS